MLLVGILYAIYSNQISPYCILLQPIRARHTNAVREFQQMLIHKVLSCWEEIQDGLDGKFKC